MEIGKDVNGNKILKLSKEEIEFGVGLSVQTNGKLVKTHRLEMGKVPEHCRDMVIIELSDYLSGINDKLKLSKLGY